MEKVKISLSPDFKFVIEDLQRYRGISTFEELCGMKIVHIDTKSTDIYLELEEE